MANRRENVVIHRTIIEGLLNEMNERTFAGELDCARIQGFLFENIQTEDFEIFNAESNVTLAVSFVPAEDNHSRHIYFTLFEGTVNKGMSKEELDSKRISEIIIVPQRFYIMTKYKGNIAWCEIVDSYCVENYEPFEKLWSVVGV